MAESEVFSAGKELEVPQSILNAAPSADLWDGQTDEGELGFSYDFVELFAGWFINITLSDKQAFVDRLCNDALEQFSTLAKAANTVHQTNKHKMLGIVNL